MNDQNLIPAKEGEKRNLKGRGKGSKNWATIFKKYAKLKMKPSELGVKMLNEELENKKLSIQEIIGMRLLLKAATKTDARDIELLINRMDGLLTQKTDITSKGEQINNLSEDELNKKIEEKLKLLNGNNTRKD